jgi:hypothetical protein
VGRLQPGEGNTQEPHLAFAIVVIAEQLLHTIQHTFVDIGCANGARHSQGFEVRVAQLEGDRAAEDVALPCAPADTLAQRAQAISYCLHVADVVAEGTLVGYATNREAFRVMLAKSWSVAAKLIVRLPGNDTTHRGSESCLAGLF